MPYAPSRLDFFAAAALTGLLAKGHTTALAPIAAAAMARTIVAELDKADASQTRPGKGALKHWARVLTQALKGIGTDIDVRRDTANNVDIYFCNGLLLSVCKDLVWLHLLEMPTAAGAKVADAALVALDLPQRVEHNGGRWYVVEKDGTRTYLTAEPHSITR